MGFIPRLFLSLDSKFLEGRANSSCIFIAQCLKYDQSITNHTHTHTQRKIDVSSVSYIFRLSLGVTAISKQNSKFFPGYSVVGRNLRIIILSLTGFMY